MMVNQHFSGLAVSDLQQRFSKLISLGTVHEIDYETATVKVKMGDWITAKLPWLTAQAAQDMTWQAPEIGEQVVVLSPCGDTAQGIVLGSLYSNSKPHHHQDHVLGGGEAYGQVSDKEAVSRTKYKDGAMVEYDREQHIYHLYVPNASGNEVAQIKVHSARDIHIECGNDATVIVGNDAKVQVANNLTAQIGNDAMVNADNNINVTAAKALSLEGDNIKMRSTSGNIEIAASATLKLNGANISAQE
ncbi:phage baseplate assembly protein V [Pseudoalteromonas piscicida]|uniref:Baseplate assembly protein n=1 Tax=Pseudoalteromonas piscicida TaxID=43662 RepID=A0A2A5JUM5_PSEO7|nr:phage baseplate assembly protein V [Pseudoalteromonas piscicida]PCK33110.1 baseplate assembly protein [Pseudoalteromonas piscicida]